MFMSPKALSWSTKTSSHNYFTDYIPFKMILLSAILFLFFKRNPEVIFVDRRSLLASGSLRY